MGERFLGLVDDMARACERPGPFLYVVSARGMRRVPLTGLTSGCRCVRRNLSIAMTGQARRTSRPVGWLWVESTVVVAEGVTM